MSKTRRAAIGDPVSQERWASRPDPESFNASMLALRIEKSRRRGDVFSDAQLAMMWGIQGRLLIESGGLGSYAASILDRYSARIATAEMLKLGMEPGRIYNAEEVRGVRDGAKFSEDSFLLMGEYTRYEELERAGCNFDPDSDHKRRRKLAEENAGTRPEWYEAEQFHEWCIEFARKHFADWLRELCLNPDASGSSPWYFHGALDALAEDAEQWRQSREATIVETSVVRQMREAFNAAQGRRTLSILEAARSVGASFAARSLCESDPGRKRYITVPPGNDEESLVREVTRRLGATDSRNYKVTQLKERIAKILESSRLLLVFDHAQGLWPQTNLRRGHPSRMEWVLSLAKDGASICFVADEQFTKTYGTVEKLLSWNSNLLADQIGSYAALPSKLTREELTALARPMLPGASENAAAAIGILAHRSPRQFPTLRNIAESARYSAKCEGRELVSDADVKNAAAGAKQADAGVRLLLERSRGSKVALPSPDPREGDATSPKTEDFPSRMPCERVNSPRGVTLRQSATALAG